MTELYVYIIDKEYPRRGEKLAGKTSLEWIVLSLDDLPFSVVSEIGSPLAEAKFIAAIPASCPLIGKEHLLSCVREMEKRSLRSASLGQGKIARREAFFGEDPILALHSPFLADLACGGVRERVTTALYEKFARRLADEGAIIEDPALVKIAADCVVEPGAIVEPFVKLENTVVRAGARIGSFSVLFGSKVEEGAEVIGSRVFDSVIGKGAKIGPFAYIRQGSAIGDHCRIGDFVEVKASLVADGAKAAHLTYVGDAEVGARTNIGCGAVFANYDGKTKHRTRIGNDVFIGANVNLIAPVDIGDGSFIAAATTVTEDVREGAFVIGRNRAEEKERKK